MESELVWKRFLLKKPFREWNGFFMEVVWRSRFGDGLSVAWNQKQTRNNSSRHVEMMFSGSVGFVLLLWWVYDRTHSNCRRVPVKDRKITNKHRDE